VTSEQPETGFGRQYFFFFNFSRDSSVQPVREASAALPGQHPFELKENPDSSHAQRNYQKGTWRTDNASASAQVFGVQAWRLKGREIPNIKANSQSLLPVSLLSVSLATF
jgi:hypothetical protein